MLAMVPLVAPKVVVADPAATVAAAGTASAAALLDKTTLAPPAGATCVRVMVQVLEEFCPRLAGLQLSEETCTGSVKVMLAVADVLL